jgi:hypothetical protein
MNKIDLTQIGGFPLEQDTLKFMQDGYADMFAAIANLVGDKVILSGVQVVGGLVTDGWITYNGEVIPFIGGALGTDVIISEATGPALFEDGVTRQVYKTKTAAIGGPGTFPFGDLTPINTIAGHFNDHANPHETTLAQVGYVASDNPDEDDATKLATTKATKVLADRIKILHADIFNIGDVPAGDPLYTVNHDQHIVGNYMVIGSYKTNSNYASNNKMPLFTWFNALADSFQFSLQEISGEVQDISLSYILVKF